MIIKSLFQFIELETELFTQLKFSIDCLRDTNGHCRLLMRGDRMLVSAGLLTGLPLGLRAWGVEVIILSLQVFLFIAFKHRQNVILNDLGRQFW